MLHVAEATGARVGALEHERRSRVRDLPMAARERFLQREGARVVPRHLARRDRPIAPVTHRLVAVDDELIGREVEHLARSVGEARGGLERQRREQVEADLELADAARRLHGIAHHPRGLVAARDGGERRRIHRLNA
jgi:hypothetical protein